MHTIKGSGSMFGFDDVAEFTHDLESFFDRVREGEIPVTKSIIDLTLDACDQIRKMVNGEDIDTGMSENILDGFRQMMTGKNVSAGNNGQADKTERKKTGESTYRIRFILIRIFLLQAAIPCP